MNATVASLVRVFYNTSDSERKAKTSVSIVFDQLLLSVEQEIFRRKADPRIASVILEFARLEWNGVREKIHLDDDPRTTFEVLFKAQAKGKLAEYWALVDSE